MSESRRWPGALIAVEGIDGAGKTTQVVFLAEALRHAGLEVVASKEPTGGPHGAALRASATTGRLSPRDELQAFLADRREHVDTLIRPALERGAVVVVDRYYYSSAAYQGARGIPVEEVIALNEAFAPRPDLVVLLDVPANVGLGRVRRRDTVENLFEREEELQRSLEIFRSLQGEHILRLDGQRPVEALHAEILEAVLQTPGVAPLLSRA